LLDGKTRVLIVDDSPFIRRAVERILAADPEISVVGSASNGAEAIERVRELAPDVVLLDVNMPEVDGLQALETIMAETPTNVILMSTLTREGAEITLRALELGAVDFIDKTVAGGTMDIYALAPILREKVRVVGGVRSRAPAYGAQSHPAATKLTHDRLQPRRTTTPRCPYDAVVIGASTGGPRALSLLIGALPTGFPAAIVIVQHMPAGFTHTLAERMDRESNLHVREARDGDPLEPGTVLVAPGGLQARVLRVDDAFRIRIEAAAPELLHRPSIDVLFTSAAEAIGERCIGVILTGMGHDGALGLEAIQRAGGRTIAESEDSALIDGMPRAARRAAEAVLPLDGIAQRVVDLCVAPGGGGAEDS
jgi:two-component system, chemotaxis family, protein-glutamate methylesterase/glutaminase